MKYRVDFVTNSSSSSYICVICDEREDAWELPDGWAYCDNGHCLCETHYDADAEENDDGEITSGCPVCTLSDYAGDELAKYLKKTRGVTREEVFAEIKKLNKRRKKLYDNEYIQFVLARFNITDDAVLQEIRDRFGTWEKFNNFLYN